MLGNKKALPGESYINAIDPGTQIFIKGWEVPLKIYLHDEVVDGEVNVTCDNCEINGISGAIPFTKPKYKISIPEDRNFEECSNCGKDIVFLSIEYTAGSITEPKFSDKSKIGFGKSYTYNIGWHVIETKDIPTLDFDETKSLIETALLLYTIGEISKKSLSIIKSKTKERNDSNNLINQTTIDDFLNG